MNDIVAIVVTYNRCELLRKNIECLLNQKGASCDIYIIDNASTDPTKEVVQSFGDERVHYFNTGSNLGGAGGFEWGIKQAVENGYRFVWAMDDDTLADSTALDEMMQASQKLNDRWGALSSAVKWTDGTYCRANRQKKTLFRFVRDEELKQESLVRVQMASFVSLLIKAEVVKKLGLPYGAYFIWTDDYEYTGRISRHYDIYVVPKSVVVHAMKNNRKINLADEISDRLERYKYVYRNDVHCYRQYGLKGWLYLLVKFSYTALNVLLHSRGHKLDKLGVLINGFKEGFSFKPELRKITDGGGGNTTDKTITIVVRVVLPSYAPHAEEAAA